MIKKQAFHLKRKFHSKQRVSAFYFKMGWLESLSSVCGGASWGLIARKRSRLELPQRTALVKTVRKFTKKKGSVQICVHRNNILTSKSSGVRMGKGKGKASGGFAWVRPGQPIFIFFRTARSVARRSVVLRKRSNLNLSFVKFFY